MGAILDRGVGGRGQRGETPSHERLQDWNSRVNIVSEEPAPPISPIPLTVHYLESGVQKTDTFQARIPVNFDSIVVSIVREFLPSVPRPQIPLRSFRDAARLGYHTGRALECSFHAPIVMQKPVFDFRSSGPNNMAHLLLDIVPYGLYARRAVGAEVVFFLSELGKSSRELLDIFGLVPVFERRRAEADVVKIYGTRGLALYNLQVSSTCGSFGIYFVPHVYSEMEFSSSPKFNKVFLARRDNRCLLNHSDVEETVARFGYRTVFMEDYSVLGQLSIGAQAKHVVAIHGAAMSFLVMNREIDSIIELLPPNFYSDLFPIALGARVKHYEQISSSFDRAVQALGWPAVASFKDLPFAIDTSLLASLLSNIH
jgi:hypothetical protein